MLDIPKPAAFAGLLDFAKTSDGDWRKEPLVLRKGLVMWGVIVAIWSPVLGPQPGGPVELKST